MRPVPAQPRDSSRPRALEEGGSQPSAGPAESRRSLPLGVVVVAAMVAGVLALYLPRELFDGRHTLLGYDFNNIHDRRIRYAQEAIASGNGLPGWYTRELMGTPFWSNIQSFPWVPTRLLVLGLDSGILFPVAVNLAAVLAALFTYRFLRQIGLGRIAAAAGGWTFAASGFFSSRVLAGHLPLLEAFGALPLLLVCLEGIASSGAGDPRLWLRHLGLAFACTCVVLCGHPQVPAYAMGAAVLYAVVRSWGRGCARALVSMALGVGMSGFIWLPMLDLIGRSTRILPLEKPVNDLAFPYWRLKAFLVPWADGAAQSVGGIERSTFVSEKTAYFWDTVCYVGWLPLVAVLVLLVRAAWRRRWPGKPWLFLVSLGAGAMLLALPFFQSLTSGLRVTLLRSPSRLVYLTTFALAATLAAGVHALLESRPGRKRWLPAAVVGALLVVHALDLGAHAKAFVSLMPRPSRAIESVQSFRRQIGDQRAGFDYSLFALGNRVVDDAGFFDSLMLARSYRAWLALDGDREGANVQDEDAATLPIAALQALCVKTLVTGRKREDLELEHSRGIVSTYAVPDPLHRATFVPDRAVRFLADEEVLRRFRKGDIDFREGMYLSPAAMTPDLQADVQTDAAPATFGSFVGYERPSSDAIVLRTSSPSRGYVRVVESWDPGWSATLDGRPAELLVADTFAMAVRVPPGPHELRLDYRTPGARVGLAITAASALLLSGFLFFLRPRRGADRSGP